MKKLIFSFVILFHLTSFSQLSNGTIAPDFTLTDWYGNTHHLYEYLEEDKTVFIEIFAAHCPGCWSYHESETLKNMYNSYGPDGTNEIMVLALEHDQYNGEFAFTGIGDPWNTAGNWLEGTPYPQFNVEGADRSVFDDYNVNFYPAVYKVCPDKKTERIFTSVQEADLYEKVQACELLEIEESKSDELKVSYNPNLKIVSIENPQELKSVMITNMQGQMVKTYTSVSNSNIKVDDLKNGVYLFQFNTESTSHIEKLVIY